MTVYVADKVFSSTDVFLIKPMYNKLIYTQADRINH